MAFDSSGKYYDPTLVNTKKAEAVLKEFASNTGGTQPTATNTGMLQLLCDIWTEVQSSRSLRLSLPIPLVERSHAVNVVRNAGRFLKL